MDTAIQSKSWGSALSFPLLTCRGLWLELKLKEFKSDSEGDFSARNRDLQHLSRREKPGPTSDGASSVPYGSLVNPVLERLGSGDQAGRLVCPPSTAAHSCPCLQRQQLLELPGALVWLHFYCVTPWTSLLSAFAMRPLVGLSAPAWALAPTLGGGHHLCPRLAHIYCSLPS